MLKLKEEEEYKQKKRDCRWDRVWLSRTDRTCGKAVGLVKFRLIKLGQLVLNINSINYNKL